MKESLRDQLRRAHDEGLLPTSEYAKYRPEIRKQLIEKRHHADLYNWTVQGDVQTVYEDLALGEEFEVDVLPISDMRADVFEVEGEPLVCMHGKFEDGRRVRVIKNGKFFAQSLKDPEA